MILLGEVTLEWPLQKHILWHQEFMREKHPYNFQYWGVFVEIKEADVCKAPHTPTALVGNQRTTVCVT